MITKIMEKVQGAKAWQTFYVLGDDCSGVEQTDVYSSGSHLTFKINTSAKNIMVYYCQVNKMLTENGAKSSLIISVKNSDFDYMINNPDSLDCTTDSSGTVTVGIYIGTDLIKHRYVDPKLESLEINWSDDLDWHPVETNWDLYYYHQNLQNFIND